MNRPVVLFLLLTMVFTACRKQVPGYEYPDFDPEPTMNAVLINGEPIQVYLSMAQRLDSVHPTPCTNAEVLLYRDGELVEQLAHHGNGRYTGSFVAEALHEYSCKVVIPGYDTLYAHAEVPAQPVVKDVNIIENATLDEDGNACPAIMITFKTDPDKRLYYQSSIDAAFFYYYYYLGMIYNSTGTRGSMNHSINTDDPVLLNEGSDLLLFSNEIISDTTYTLKVNASFNSHSYSSSGQAVTFDSIVRSGYVVVSMSGIAESCYQYRKSQEAFQAPDAYTNLFLGTITPLNLYSNVENGRGLFTAIAPVTCDTVFLR
ncbi:MAG: DUF4249 family protein [Bacteroidales bacterium]|nr:DUF4249 family protein [Bacteroidales bacterium]